MNEATSDNPTPEPELDLNSATDAILGLMGTDPEETKEPEPAKEPEAPKEDDKAAVEGDDNPPVSEEVKEPDEEPEFEVTVDGAKLKVKQSELLSGYQRQADYTRKTQEAAQIKQQAEQTLAQERSQYQQAIQTLMQQVQTAVQSGQLAPPDPALLDTNPVEYLKQQTRWEQAKAAFQDAQARDQQIKAQQAEEAKAQRAQHLATEAEQLIAKLPSWKDETKRAAENRELSDYLVKAGYQPEQVKATSDHKAVVLAYKAMQYDKLIAEQKAIVKNKVPAPQPKTAKPGTSSDETNPINKSAVQRLRRSGSTEDAASAIASLMN